MKLIIDISNQTKNLLNEKLAGAVILGMLKNINMPANLFSHFYILTFPHLIALMIFAIA